MSNVVVNELICLEKWCSPQHFTNLLVILGFQFVLLPLHEFDVIRSNFCLLISVLSRFWEDLAYNFSVRLY